MKLRNSPWQLAYLKTWLIIIFRSEVISAKSPHKAFYLQLQFTTTLTIKATQLLLFRDERNSSNEICEISHSMAKSRRLYNSPKQKSRRQFLKQSRLPQIDNSLRGESSGQGLPAKVAKN